MTGATPLERLVEVIEDPYMAQGDYYLVAHREALAEAAWDYWVSELMRAYYGPAADSLGMGV